MKLIGIVRKIDDLGRVVLPKELRRTMGIDDRDAIEIYVEDEKVILKKYQPACCFCNEDDGNLKTFNVISRSLPSSIGGR
jgi:transcriptional pleiotropic regulator of transition state genes